MYPEISPCCNKCEGNEALLIHKSWTGKRQFHSKTLRDMMSFLSLEKIRYSSQSFVKNVSMRANRFLNT